MDVRILVAADAAGFQALRLSAIRECPMAFSSSHEEESAILLSRVAERFAPTAERAVFGAFEGEALVGIAGIQRERARKLAHKAVIWGVYVAPPFRRGGVGRLLLRAALAHAASMEGLLQVNLGANAASPAPLALYKSLGFEPYGIEKGFLRVDGVLYDEVHMVRVIAEA